MLRSLLCKIFTTPKSAKLDRVMDTVAEVIEHEYPESIITPPHVTEKYEAEARIFFHQRFETGRSIMTALECRNGVCHASIFIGWAEPDEIRKLEEFKKLFEESYEVKCKVNKNLAIESGASIICYGGLESLENVFLDLSEYARKLAGGEV